MPLVVMPTTTRTIIRMIHHDRVGPAGTKTTTTTTTGNWKRKQSKYYCIHAAELIIILRFLVVCFPLILLSITLVSIHSSTVSILDPTRTILFFVRVEELVNSRTAHTAANGETIPSDWSYRCRWEGGGGRASFAAR